MLHQTMRRMKLFALFPALVCCLCNPITLHDPFLNVEIPPLWQEESVIIVSDSLDLALSIKKGLNILIENEVVWYKIIKPSPAYLKTVEKSYYSYLEDKPSLRVDAYYKNGEIKKYIDLKYQTDIFYKYDFYSYKTGFNIVTAEIPDYQNIVFVRCSCRRQIHRPEQFGFYTLRSAYATIHKHITLRWPSTLKLNYGLTNREGISIDSSFVKTHNDNQFVVECENLPSYGTIHCKFPELWYAALCVSFPPKGSVSYSWQELGDYRLQLYADSLKNKKMGVIDSIAHENKASGEDSTIAKIFTFVQTSIRYYGSWENSFGWVPRDPETVIKNGYGDCKEMAMVACYLLNKQNISAWPALVKTTGFQYIEAFPSLNAFNHVIVCVDRRNSLRLYLDPTNKFSTWQSSCNSLIGQKTLILRNGSSITDSIGPNEYYKNTITTFSRFIHASDDGQWLLSGEANLKGEIAERIFYAVKNSANRDPKDLLRDWMIYTLKITPAECAVRIFNYDSIVVTYTAAAGPCFMVTPQKGVFLTLPSLHTPDYELCDLSNEGDRFLHRIEQNDTWTIPPEFTSPVTTDLNNAYGKGSWSIAGDQITRHYSTVFFHVDVVNKNELKAYIAERNKFARGVIWTQKNL
jgi:hypothetical protein